MKFKVLIWIFSVFAMIGLQSCDDDDNEITLQEGEVQYEVSFEMKWNGTDFPTDYPSNAHFSKLIGWTHKLGNTFFAPETMASEGIKVMAETGGTSPLDDELQAMITAGKGLKYFIGSNLGSGSGTIKLNIVIDKDNSAVSLVSMVAPSPDWYVGVLDVNLIEDNAFVEQKTVEAKVYDAGTDSGVTFTSANSVTNPQEKISLFVDSPLGNGTKLDAVFAEVTFKKVKE